MAENKYVLDTQVALWIMLGSEEVPEKSFRERFLGEDTLLIFHQVSTWEIQIKYSLGKLKLPKRPEAFLRQSVTDSGFVYETIDDKAIFFLDKLPEIHRDPFDRLLIAHACANGWTMITADRAMEKYPLRVELV